MEIKRQVRCNMSVETKLKDVTVATFANKKHNN